jgi:hypothetical protein
VPRISDIFADCAVYLYRSRADAEAGERRGGSGFMVLVPFENDRKWSEIYVITNRHVIVNAGAPVIRLNRKDGRVEYFETEADGWSFHPDGDDVAAIPIRFAYDEMQFHAVWIGTFITSKIVTEEDVGIGDDTFMVGRFVNHEGKQQNAPAVRYGNIAMMPKEKIESPTGIAQESFLVEVRSLPGYSGSAVFLYSPSAMNDMSIRRKGRDKPPPTNNFSRNREEFDTMMAFMEPKGPYLLGSDWCHIPNRVLVRDENGEALPSRWYVEENTGMAGVIPAWKIADILNSEEFVKRREIAAEEIKQRQKNASVTLDSADGDNAPEFTQHDFETALKKASRNV